MARGGGERRARLCRRTAQLISMLSKNQMTNYGLVVIGGVHVGLFGKGR